MGLDVGLTSFVVDSEGNEIENPRCAEQSADKLAKLQRKLARAVRGSNNYKSLKDKIALHLPSDFQIKLCVDSFI